MSRPHEDGNYTIEEQHWCGMTLRERMFMALAQGRNRGIHLDTDDVWWLADAARIRALESALLKIEAMDTREGGPIRDAAGGVIDSIDHWRGPCAEVARTALNAARAGEGQGG